MAGGDIINDNFDYSLYPLPGREVLSAPQSILTLYTLFAGFEKLSIIRMAIVY
jgi:hypothetical protein